MNKIEHLNNIIMWFYVLYVHYTIQILYCSTPVWGLLFIF